MVVLTSWDRGMSDCEPAPNATLGSLLAPRAGWYPLPLSCEREVPRRKAVASLPYLRAYNYPQPQCTRSENRDGVAKGSRKRVESSEVKCEICAPIHL